MKSLPNEHRAPLLFGLLTAGILLAGGALVWALGGSAQPRQGVHAAGALPVYSAVGLEAGSAEFWPWAALREARTAQGSPELSVRDPDEGFAPGFVNALLETGFGFVGLEGLNGECLVLSGADTACFLTGLTFRCSPALTSADPPEGREPVPMTADIALGYRHNRLALTLTVEAGEGYASLPEDWPAGAQQQVEEELLFLVNLSNDDRHGRLLHFMQTLFGGASQLDQTPFFDSGQQLRWRMGGAAQFSHAMGELASRLQLAQQVSLEWYSDRGFQPARPRGALYDHQTLLADPMPQPKALARVLAEAGLELQLVPLDHQLLLLFSWQTGSLGVYYDPLLDQFAGFGFQ